MPAYMQPAAGAPPDAAYGAAGDPFRAPERDSANGYHQGAGGDSSSWAMAHSISQSSDSRLRDRCGEIENSYKALFPTALSMVGYRRVRIRSLRVRRFMVCLP